MLHTETHPEFLSPNMFLHMVAIHMTFWKMLCTLLLEVFHLCIWMYFFLLSSGRQLLRHLCSPSSVWHRWGGKLTSSSRNKWTCAKTDSSRAETSTIIPGFQRWSDAGTLLKPAQSFLRQGSWWDGEKWCFQTSDSDYLRRNPFHN